MRPSAAGRTATPKARIRIGYSLEEPYVYKDSNGKLVGLEYEIGQKLALRLGIKRVEWVESDYASLISGLEAGKYDMVIAGIFITRGRADQVDFSEPLFHVSQGLVVKKGNPFNLHSYVDIEQNPQVKVAVVRGAVEDELFQGWILPASRIVGVPDEETGRVAVVEGMADALALSAPSATMMRLRRNLSGAEVATPFSQSQPKGILSGYAGLIFRKTDGSLRQAWNEQIAKFVGSSEHIFLLQKYGFNQADLPGTVTTSQILASGS